MTKEEFDLLFKVEKLWIDGYQGWKTMQSSTGNCCGGKGVSIWKPNNQRWECSDCGTVTSNDPSYVTNKNTGEKELPYWAQKVPKKCECGADKVYGPNSGMHSATMPCPLYVKA